MIWNSIPLQCLLHNRKDVPPSLTLVDIESINILSNFQPPSSPSIPIPTILISFYSNVSKTIVKMLYMSNNALSHKYIIFLFLVFYLLIVSVFYMLLALYEPDAV